jgi:50S ribosomal protein L16 3-hydroxylase
VLQAPLPELLASPEHVFDRLVAASERWRAGDRSFDPEFCVDHARILADVGRYLPSPADGSIAAWTDRVTRMLGGRAFGLVVDGYQAHDEPVFQRLCDFVSGLYAHTGLPGEQAKAGLFLGNYARTPFGLHRGRSTNFMFVLDGVKRIRAWPAAFFRGKEDLTNRLDYEQHNEASTILEGRPGDVVYWPSPYWHIGEDAGGFSVAISLMLFMEPRPGADLAVALDQLGGAVRGRGGVRGAVRALQALARDPRLERALVAARLRHATGFGFSEPPPAAAPRRLGVESIVRGRPEAPIQWRRVGDELICSAGGHAFALPDDPRVPGLLRRLNSGQPRRVGDEMSRCAGRVRRARAVFDASPADVQALLERLLALRAITDRP